MYTATRLEWHQDVDANRRTLQISVWSCQTTNELLISVIRFVVALAKSQDHRVICRVFAFGQTVLHTIVSVQPDGVEEKGTRYVERLGGSSRITRATGRIIKSRGVAYASMMILFIRGKVPFLSTLRCGVGGSLGKN